MISSLMRVGVAGFEPTTSSSRTKHAPKLRNTPREATTAYRTGHAGGQTLIAGPTRGARGESATGVPQHGQALAVLGFVDFALGVGIAQRALALAADTAAPQQHRPQHHQGPEHDREDQKPGMPRVIAVTLNGVGKESRCGWGDLVNSHDR